MDTYELTFDGQTFTVTDGKGEAHARAVAAALERRLADIRATLGAEEPPERIALMAALYAEAELLDAKGG
jgi:hypothetical protein